MEIGFFRASRRAWALALILPACSSRERVNAFQSDWPPGVVRTWVGPAFWANRLQDWRIADGRLECVEASSDMPMRTVHLLTRRLGPGKGSVEMSVTTGPLGPPEELPSTARAGFLIGVGAGLDYRAAALVHHSYGPGGGLFFGVDGQGRLVAMDFTKDHEILSRRTVGGGPFNTLRLELTLSPAGGAYDVELASLDPDSRRRRDRLRLRGVAAERVEGNLALVSHPGESSTGGRGARFWFRRWQVSGPKLEVHEERRCGPVLATQYTLSRGILKLTAQMMPIGESDPQEASLEIQEEGAWRRIATRPIDRHGYTAGFRITDWDGSRDVDYRVVYALPESSGGSSFNGWKGTIRREPVEQPTLTLAAFTGNHNLGAEAGGADAGSFPWAHRVWFPHTDLTQQVARQDPDLLFFSGDQIYEIASPTRPERRPLNKAELDYLYKWYLWCWAFRDLTRNRPTITIPDDHDVYQGNLWGEGGRATDTDNRGGYVMPAEWVNMVQRTQTSHLPDPYDPTPVEQGIGVYYTDLRYAGVSFAIVEDRKFKSGPAGRAPPSRSGRPDHVIDPHFDPASADVPGATLLGERQLQFLEAWAADWEQTDMKAVLSQTLWANATSLHGPEKKRLVADYDSNGWPPSGRNRALRVVRKAYAVHISGDQHLGILLHYGVDEWNDASLAFSVPSIANFYPRVWKPLVVGRHREPGAPEWTGEFLDGLGNRITVLAVANPGQPTGREPAALYDRMPGYGIVRFDKAARRITFECWPRGVAHGREAQYPGWPRSFPIEANDSRQVTGYLTTLELRGLSDPVLQVFQRKELVYALRVKGSTVRPWVYEPGSYTVKVGEPGTEEMKTLRGLVPLPSGVKRTFLVEF